MLDAWRQSKNKADDVHQIQDPGDPVEATAVEAYVILSWGTGRQTDLMRM